MTNTKTVWSAWEILFVAIDILIMVSVVLFFAGFAGMLFGWNFYEYLFLACGAGFITAFCFNYPSWEKQLMITLGIASLAIFVLVFLSKRGYWTPF